MTLDELKAFVAVSDAGSFTRASDVLNRSQPAVSRRIDLLEKELGTPLFERRGRSVALTGAGESLLPHAEDALAAVQDGYRAVRERLKQAEGSLTLAVVGTIADSYLVEVLEPFRSQFEHVRLELRTANSQQVSDLVRRGDATIGLRYCPDSDPRLDVTPLGSERLYVVVPANHRIKAKRQNDLSAFAEDRWLGFPEDRKEPESFGSLLETTLSTGGAKRPQITTIDSLTAQKRLVEAGFGIALMPKRHVMDELRGGSLRIIQVASVTAQMPVVMVQRRGSTGGAPTYALTTLLRAGIPPLLDQ